MNRALLITIGIAILLVILGIWVYLMLFGAPKSGEEVFTNLGFSLTPQSTTISNPPEDSSSIEDLVDTNTGSFRQLTTRPVAGFAASSTPGGQIVRYAERGTGHIYEIDMGTGAENIISRTTIPQVARALFAPNANTVALTSFENYTNRVVIGTIASDSLKNTSLEPGADNLAYTQAGDVLYTIVRDGATTGYEQDLSTETRREIFTFNFTNLDVAWGGELAKTYLTTKPATNLEGFIYTITNNAVTPAAPSALGLSALVHKELLVTTARGQNGATSIAQYPDGTRFELPIVALKEKCVVDVSNNDYLWCAAPLAINTASYLDDWYTGTLQSNDELWLVDIKKKTAELVASPSTILKRPLDITDLRLNSDNTQLLFKNKVDQTLWLYDLLASSQ